MGSSARLSSTVAIPSRLEDPSWSKGLSSDLRLSTFAAGTASRPVAAASRATKADEESHSSVPP